MPLGLTEGLVVAAVFADEGLVWETVRDADGLAADVEVGFAVWEGLVPLGLAVEDVAEGLVVAVVVGLAVCAGLAVGLADTDGFDAVFCILVEVGDAFAEGLATVVLPVAAAFAMGRFLNTNHHKVNPPAARATTAKMQPRTMPTTFVVLGITTEVPSITREIPFAA